MKGAPTESLHYETIHSLKETDTNDAEIMQEGHSIGTWAQKWKIPGGLEVPLRPHGQKEHGIN